ncbi:MAG: glycine cleavage system protein R [gamma proteobacterium symbiont of Taylorina sp.]|nr:glycine cleavage system protein R [gamma proteobacterium symbiont of Taylorina sp.]
MLDNSAKQLVISAIGTDRPGIINEISQLIIHNKGNIDDSRMTVLGGEFAIILLISASADALNTIEDELNQQASSLKLNVITKQTGDNAPIHQNSISTSMAPYVVEVLSIDNPGIVYKLAGFFSSQQINIQSMQTSRYPAPHTGTQMFAIEMIITIPENIMINELREDFLDLCDDMNLDASIEASRP